MASAAVSLPALSTTTAAPPAPLSKTLLSSARSLVLLQLLSRALTFTLNHALLRFASPEVFGTASIQFDLIGSTLLFLSREGIRGALLRSGRSDDEAAALFDGGKDNEAQKAASRQARRQRDLNLSLVPLPLFLALAAVVLPLYLRYSPQSTLGQPFFYPSLALHLLAYLLELLSEPYHVRLQSDLRLGVRVQAEGAAVIAKAVVTLAGVYLMRERGGALLGFGFGQLAYGLVLLGRFAAAFGDQAGRMWVPRKAAGPSGTGGGSYSPSTYLDPSSFSLARAMTQQSVVKHFLTEGDRMIVARVSPLKDQGGYAVATNYGSLVARIVFQPLEETARLYFSKSLQQASSDPPTTAGDEPSTADDSDSVGAALTILTALLRFSSHLLVLLPALGPPFVPLALSVLLPSSRWSGARLQTPLDILRTFTVYLPLLSANGMLEALFAATATPADLARQSTAMVAFSGAFVACALAAGRALGRPEQGLVVANCVNAACRIAFAAAHARRWFGARGARPFSLRDVWPSAQVVVVGGLAAVGVRLSARWNADGLAGPTSAAKHVGVGATFGVSCLLVAWRNERRLLRLALGALREKRE